jgi:hypothetical protein
MNKLSAAQHFTNLLLQENEIYKQTLLDFASRPLPDYMVMARAKETLARAASVVANMSKDKT